MAAHHLDRPVPSEPSRRGVWLLPLAGIAGALIFTYWETAPDARTDVPGGAEWVTSTPGFTSGVLYILSLVALLLGLTALYGCLADHPGHIPALAGLILGVLSVGLILTTMGAGVLAAAVVADEYLSGNTAVAPALEDLSGGNFGTPIIIAFAGGVLAALASSIAFGYAIWRSGTLPKWSGILVGVGLVLFLATAPIVTQLGGILLAVGGAWIARTVATTGITPSVHR